MVSVSTPKITDSRTSGLGTTDKCQTTGSVKLKEFNCSMHFMLLVPIFIEQY